ncbi:Core-2/I-branching beta-16-N-acetylglucosaminyltransferase family protein [Zea mays]|uniref:Core-2/I-branching beta-16-N-acetylglucosaminyltransferase family protein n=1 Tax=Zea mays TaxID=4577 RepID=A0A1D6H1T9_MAIZE|nr:Core-2/I-branching beta-16-N-acetylglucosaminyltransferase family protein [Zea mays]
MTAMPHPRHRGAAKKPMWIIVLLSLVCVALMGAYVYPPRRYSACYFFASSVCTPFKDWLPAVARERTDEEIVSSVVIRDLLSMPMAMSKNPKIAFMFLTPGSLPFEKLWEKFLQGHDGRYSIYIHASREKPVHSSSLFVGREIHSEKVVWGRISMVDAEKRLLGNALEDVDNQFFVLLSDRF